MALTPTDHIRPTRRGPDHNRPTRVTRVVGRMSSGRVSAVTVLRNTIERWTTWSVSNLTVLYVYSTVLRSFVAFFFNRDLLVATLVVVYGSLAARRQIYRDGVGEVNVQDRATTIPFADREC